MDVNKDNQERGHVGRGNPLWLPARLLFWHIMLQALTYKQKVKWWNEFQSLIPSPKKPTPS